MESISGTKSEIKRIVDCYLKKMESYLKMEIQLSKL